MRRTQKDKYALYKKQKRGFRTKFFVAITLVFACIIVGVSIYMGTFAPGYAPHIPFKSLYTPKEHVERLAKISEERYAHLIESGELVNVRVEILHAFYDDDPEFFLITLEFAKEWKYNCSFEHEGEFQTKYMHTIGKIEADAYNMGLWDYDGQVEENVFSEVINGGIVPPNASSYIETWWRNGRSAYDLCDLEYTKKYFGGRVQAVETANGIIELHRSRYFNCHCIEFCFQNSQRVIPRSEYRKLRQESGIWVKGAYDYEKNKPWNSYPVSIQYNA